MRIPTLLSALRRRAAAGALVGAAGLAAAGCQNDLDITDPNAPSQQTFWTNAAAAEAGVVAAYNGLLRTGTGQRWWAFAHDMRSDIGTTTSPWAELRAFVKFQFPSGYDFEVNREIFTHSYELIQRANQVTTNVPGIDMDAARRTRLVGDAKFLRAMTYFNLIALYGGNIPLITEPVTATDRPASSDSARIFAQIEQDLTDAVAALPVQSAAAASGRATRGAAQGLLGKVQLQQRKWPQAAATLQAVVNGQVGTYALLGEAGTAGAYADLFRNTGNNSVESLFEIQMGNVDLCAQGVCGLNVSKMIGPCGPSYCDGLPNAWYYSLFREQRTAAGALDPRLDATLFYYKGDTTQVFNRTWAQRYGGDTTRLYFKKYGEYYTSLVESTWEAPINYKVLRYADVLLMYAEALNEQGQTAAAYPHVNRVRARVGLAPLAAGLSQAGMRNAILRERLLEFGLEGQRWLDIGRHNLFAALKAESRTRDADFDTFEVGTSVLLPIPQNERNLNPNINQNPGYR